MARRRKETAPEDLLETRKRIVATAHRLFMELGYRAVSTRVIADACGLTQPALYHHFADKQELYLEVIREILAKNGEALERIRQSGEPLEERLRRAAAYLLLHAPPNMNVMFHDMRHELDEASRASVHEWFRQGFVGPLAALFGEGQREGRLKSREEGGADPFSSAFLLLSISRSMLNTDLEREAGEGEQELREKTASERAALIVNILLHGMVRRTGESAG
ncbi:TetR/AcrR family transcriptional regulator [Paenibacillus mucilaginosus]|uniref:TetR family transcriptional regulator n=2 Tax=Paenibacillus mucilaginosus TaxID=61624 RepID=H6NRD0_9BACL|nr:TetR/AcrR family transcriptional regulator [Paenibacillus mucilaginosus]AEI45925.1 transcriptional regulator, TetR family [Paenibacillus mucilaginosus KNP414]AFC33565.1 TetR family transcriptional regulator [Paenibacillus mucilaginosus 3016]MCG7216787.1 TetR/AcrR family transcriptional regulator [Paenibacillus mucilaginosus]WDM27279.1 TetR/AcrR family transcriptional regulator [Paenibacillus mucilaginosus]WFA21967.1 TetR/AcrR family transcriptional regulator [Paenibacillus mucilaginosus]